MKQPQKYLVIDDLALELQERPIFVPIPDAALKDDKSMTKFTLSTLKQLMKLSMWTWFHRLEDVTINGYMVRMHNIYPNFST